MEFSKRILERYKTLYKLLKDLESIPSTIKPNIIELKTVIFKPTKDLADRFNKILAECKKTLKKLKRTESGGISLSSVMVWPSYDYKICNTGAELIVLIPQGFYRIQFRTEIKKENGKSYSGTNCYYKFIKMCEKYKVDLSKYEISEEEGLYQKSLIPMPLIKMENDLFLCPLGDGEGIKNVHHIDFHNSYPAGLINTHPEFKIIFEKIVEELPHELSKAVLNLTIGFFQSQWCNYKYAELAKDAICDNIERMNKLANELKQAGRIILAYNTDGIWYKGDIFHSTMEGKNFGQCENDHKNCTIRFKSVGAYEYMEGKRYTPVVRGSTNLDATLPRDQWKWGDIYNSEIVIFYLTEEGVIYGEEKYL